MENEEKVGDVADGEEDDVTAPADENNTGEGSSNLAAEIAKHATNPTSPSAAPRAPGGGQISARHFIPSTTAQPGPKRAKMA